VCWSTTVLATYDNKLLTQKLVVSWRSNGSRQYRDEDDVEDTFGKSGGFRYPTAVSRISVQVQFVRGSRTADRLRSCLGNTVAQIFLRYGKFCRILSLSPDIFWTDIQDDRLTNNLMVGKRPYLTYQEVISLGIIYFAWTVDNSCYHILFYY